MADILEPVSEEDPCGPDMRWESDFTKFMGDVEALQAQFSSFADDDEEQGANRPPGPSLQSVIDDAEEILEKTKDVGVAAIRVEMLWRLSGLHAFAEALGELVAMIEKWPGGSDGVHPRADPEDGDLFERGAPLGKLVREIPAMVRTLGWGNSPADPAVRQQASETLSGVFDNWMERLEEPVGDSLPSSREAWDALRTLSSGEVPPDDVGMAVGGEDYQGGGAAPVSADAWDLLAKTFERMQEQNKHSPVVPLLRVMLDWREIGLEDIAAEMKQSGVSLEQILDSVVRIEQRRAEGGGNY